LFDSGRIADRVGVVELRDQAGVCDASGGGETILATARQQGYDLLTLSTPQPVDLMGFEARGVLLHLAGQLGDMMQRTARIPIRGTVRPVEDGDWPAIEALLPEAGATRFSMDPTLDPARVRRHKLDMLRIYAKRDPDHALVALADESLVGFQVSLWDRDAIVFYEIVVHPTRRSGFVALSLLAENIRRFADHHPPQTPVRTRIYEDNTVSLTLFEKLALHVTNQRQYYYHARP